MSSSTASPSTSIRVLHTADWHLGKTLGDLDRAVEHRRFLDWLLALIIREKVDVLLVAGDIFDTANPPQSAERLYFEFLANIYRKTKCAVVITGGNHDSPAHLEAPSRVLKPLNVHVTGALPADITDLLVLLPSEKDPQLIIAAIPFLRDRDLRTGTFGQSTDEIREELRDGIEKIYRDAADACSGFSAALIAAGHLTVAGARVSESERDVHVGGLGKVEHKIFPEEFDYIALGHLHRPQAVGTEAIRYSGSPIPLSFSESEDIKEVRLLDFEGGKLIKNQGLEIPVIRRLAQLKTDRTNLEADLAAFDPKPGELPTWLEISVQTTDASENLFELARKICEDKKDTFEIVRVQAKMARAFGTLTESNAADFQDIDDLLDNPREVFEQRLKMASELPDEEVKSLRDVFRQLYQLHIDAEKGEDEPEPTLESATAVEISQPSLFDFGEEPSK
jgi:exonuclease SbcD